MHRQTTQIAPAQTAILTLLGQRPGITTAMVAEALALPVNTTRALLSKLYQAGAVTKVMVRARTNKLAHLAIWSPHTGPAPKRKPRAETTLRVMRKRFRYRLDDKREACVALAQWERGINPVLRGDGKREDEDDE